MNKHELYGDYRRSRQWKDNLHRKAAHKALDIPEDQMAVTVKKSGIGALGAIGIALAAGLPVAALAGFLLSQSKPEPQTHIIEKPGATVVKPVGKTVTVEVLPPEK